MDRFSQFADHSNFHGIKDLYRLKSSWTVLLWAVSLATCTGLMIYECFMVSFQYRRHPTATQISPYYPDFYPYPRILFCPNEWVNESRVSEFNISKPVLIYALSLLQDLILQEKEKRNFIKTSIDVDLAEAEFELKSFLADMNYTTYIDFYNLISDDPELVISCDGCDFMIKQLTSSGICYQIRLRPAPSSFQVRLPPSIGYTAPIRDPIYANLTPKYVGTYLSDTMYVSYVPEKDFFFYDPILLNRNWSYTIRVTPVLYRRMNKPQRPCVPLSDALELPYSEYMCYGNCDSAKKIKYRGCAYMSDRKNVPFNQSNTFSETKLCTSLHLVSPTENSSIVEQEYNDCIKQCIPLCYEWIYEATVFSVQTRKLFAQRNEQDINIVFSYQVRYGETIMEEVATYSWHTFLSNVGGQLGLWVGASVLTLLQIVYYFGLLLYDQAVRMIVGCRRKKISSSCNRNEIGNRKRDETPMTTRPIFFVEHRYWFFPRKESGNGIVAVSSSTNITHNRIMTRRNSTAGNITNGSIANH